MSFVTAVPETLAVCVIHGSAGHVLATPRLLRKFCCALGATTDSAGVQDGLIRDVPTAEQVFHVSRTCDDRSLPVRLWMATVPWPVSTQ